MANDREQFDATSFLADFDKEFDKGTDTTPEPEQSKEAAAPDTQDTQEPEPVVEEQPVEEQVEAPENEELPETPAEEPEASVETVNDPDVHKRNEAFKKLREEKEKLEQSDKFLADLAGQYGLTKEELVTKFKEEQAAKAAKAQGIPIEQYKRMQQLEQEVSTIKERYAQEAFNYEAERLVQKYNIPQGQVQDVFAKIGALGLDVLSNPKLLDVAYKALNYDVALEKGRQAQLQETKKRRETTASPTLGTKGTNVDTSGADMDSEIDAFLKEKLGR
jgi:hypothetical protein